MCWQSKRLYWEGVPYGEGNGTPLQYSCLENPMDGGTWWATVHGVAKSRHDWATSLSLFTFMHWRRKWQPTPVFLPGESQRQWAPVYGVAQSRTRLKRLSSSSSSSSNSSNSSSSSSSGLLESLRSFLQSTDAETSHRAYWVKVLGETQASVFENKLIGHHRLSSTQLGLKHGTQNKLLAWYPVLSALASSYLFSCSSLPL